MEKYEAMRYVKEELTTLITMYAEVDYTVDRLGNIVFRDRKKVCESIRRAIEQTSRELHLKQDDVRYYLTYIYKQKSKIKPSFSREGNELVRILNEIGKQQRKEKENHKQQIIGNQVSR